MIPPLLRMTLAIGVAGYFVIILIFLKNRALELKYTLLWLAAGAVMLIFVLFPSLMPAIVRLIGIESNMNGLFIIVLAFLIILTMALTSIVSKQMRKINKLVQEIAGLEKRVRDLENK